MVLQRGSSEIGVGSTWVLRSPAPNPGDGFVTAHGCEPELVLSRVSNTKPWRWFCFAASRVRSGRVSSTKPWRWLCSFRQPSMRWSPISSLGEGLAGRAGLVSSTKPWRWLCNTANPLAAARVLLVVSSTRPWRRQRGHTCLQHQALEKALQRQARTARTGDRLQHQALEKALQPGGSVCKASPVPCLQHQALEMALHVVQIQRHGQQIREGSA